MCQTNMLHGALFVPLMMTDDRDSDSVSVCVMNDELGSISRTPSASVSLKLSLRIVFVMFFIHHPLQHEVSDAVPGPEASAALLSRPPPLLLWTLRVIVHTNLILIFHHNMITYLYIRFKILSRQIRLRFRIQCKL